jgi:hypothetical protein
MRAKPSLSERELPLILPNPHLQLRRADAAKWRHLEGNLIFVKIFRIILSLFCDKWIVNYWFSVVLSRTGQ